MQVSVKNTKVLPSLVTDHSSIKFSYFKNAEGNRDTGFRKFNNSLTENEEYVLKVCKQQLDAIYKEKAKGIKIRSKCNWYEHGEKFTKFFLNLEKHRLIQSQKISVIINQEEITGQEEINKQIFSFYQYLFSRKVQFHTDKIEAYLENINIPLPKLINEQTLGCEGIISEDEVFKSLKSMENNKSSGNDGLSKEFYEYFFLG